MDLRGLQQLNNGFGDALARAFEMVATPAVFGFLGFLLDRRLGTSPLFALTFGVIVFGYMVWKFWAQYEREMQRHEAELLQGSRRRTVVAEQSDG